MKTNISANAKRLFSQCQTVLTGALITIMITPYFAYAQPEGVPPGGNIDAGFNTVTTIGGVDIGGLITAGTGNKIITTITGFLDITQLYPGTNGQFLRMVGTIPTWVAATFITEETDPIFGASDAAGITSTNIGNWNTAHGWGNHALAGYLTSFAETDPNAILKSVITTTGDIIYATGSGVAQRLGIGSAGQILTVVAGVPAWANAPAGFSDPMTTRGDIIYRNSTNTTTRLARGTAGQVIKSNGTDIAWGTETDPIFELSDAAGITGTDITNWDTAYGWEDHSTQGYLSSEFDTLASVTGRGNTTTSTVTLDSGGTGTTTVGGNLSVKGATGILLGELGTPNTPGRIRLFENGSDSYTVTITTGDQTASYTLYLPTGLPTATAFLKSTISGELSWDTTTYAPASTTLTTSTSFGGDVSGTYNNIQLGTGVVGADELASTSVSNGSYGSASNVGTFTVDQDGRLTAAGNTAIAIGAGAITSGTLGITRGGTNLATSTDDHVMVGSGTTWESKALPNCTTGKLLYNTSTNVFSCGTDQTGITAETDPVVGAVTGIVKSDGAGIISAITDSSTNWNTAYSERRQWDGESTNLVPATGRTSLGATTVGGNLFTLTNPSAITFPRFNANNTISALTATDFRTAIGAGTGSGTVTSVGLSLPAFITVSGSPVTGSGTLTGTLASQTANNIFAAPNGSAGAPTFRALAAADIPTLDIGTKTSGTLAVARGGTNLTVTGTAGNLLRSNGSAWESWTPNYLTSYTETDPTWTGTANTTSAISRTGTVSVTTGGTSITGSSSHSSGTGLMGTATTSTGTTYGVYGSSASSGGFGGYFTNTSAGTGLYGNSSSGNGIWGNSTSAIGIYGASGGTGTNGTGIVGLATSTTGITYGVRGTVNSTEGLGVYGQSSTGTRYGYLGGNTYAGYAQYDANNYVLLGTDNSGSSTFGTAYGTFGSSTNTTGAAYGVRGQASSTSGYGVAGSALATSGTTYGVYGSTSSATGYGVYGTSTPTTGSSGAGVYGISSGQYGRGVEGNGYYGVYGTGSHGGVWGISNAAGGRGVDARSSFNSTSDNYAIYTYASNTGSGNAYGIYASGEVNYLGGNTGINTAPTTETLDVNGTVRVRTVLAGAYSTPLNRTSLGVFTTATSDRTMKTNLEPLDPALKNVINMKPYTFNWIGEPDGPKDIGLIAQDIINVYPALVYKSDDNKYGLNYPLFTVVLVKAIKEQYELFTGQQTKIERLESQMTEKDAQITNLQEQINELKSLINRS